MGYSSKSSLFNRDDSKVSTQRHSVLLFCWSAIRHDRRSRKQVPIELNCILKLCASIRLR
jgi:uncharacterized membrane protein (UPF0136 family)